MVLLALISLARPPPPDPTSDLPPRRTKKDPERSASTLDPELLLDFLTDRLNIWRVMKDVKLLGMGDASAAEPKAGPEVAAIEDKDEVQDWWEQVVETL